MLIRLGQMQPPSLSQLAQRLDTPLERVQPALETLVRKGYVNDEAPSLTRTGAAAYSRLVEARRKGLEALLRGWPPEQQREMAGTIASLAERFLSDDFDRYLRDSTRRMQATVDTT
jgi:DNA-binding MarR family transcriptional regulator